MVTIVILIILATISINAVFGENGIIKQAQKAKELQEQKEKEEQEGLNTLDQYVGNYLNGNGGGEKLEYNDNVLPTAPKVADGMTKVKYNSESGKWEKVTDEEAEWYDYDKKEWANVVLGDATFNSDGTLDESKPYSQLVWIPRYAYKITSLYHTASEEAGDIEVVFIDTANRNRGKTTTYKTEYPEATVGGGMSDFVVHPAFNYGGQKLTGFWMGKFESSHTGCTTDIETGQATYTGNEVMMVKANVTSWRNMTIGEAFSICLNMNKTGNPYKLSNNDNIVDPHMVKNDEWGAVAYLSKSKYGKQNEEVFINNNSNYITGIAGDTASAESSTSTTNKYNTTAGMKASTTGNITGIYDMSGGNWERVAAYIKNGNSSLITNGGDLVKEGTEDKYRNVYTSTVNDGSSAYEADYALTEPTNVDNKNSGTAKYGDAVWETSNHSLNANNWYVDYSVFPYSTGPFWGRGGHYDDITSAGIFYFNRSTGMSGASGGFRVVVPVL